MTDNQENEEYIEVPKPRLWYVLQFITLILMALIGGSTFTLLAVNTAEALFGVNGLEVVGLSEYSTRNELFAVRYIQILSSIGTFIFAPIAQLAFMREPLIEGTGIKNPISLRSAMLAAMLVIVMQPAVSGLVEWCLNLHLPDSMADLEAELRKAHDRATAAQFAFVKDQSFLDLLFNLFLMAALPAFAEELFFRRVGMRLLFDITRNAHVAIFISAALFAMVHGQFFYLIPLFLFGLVLGYLALWSRSLWLPVLAHFTNNALSVILSYVYNDPAADEVDMGAPMLAMVISILLSVFILLLLKKRQVQD